MKSMVTTNKNMIDQHAVFFSLKGARFPCRDREGLPSVPLSITTEINPASVDQAERKTARALIELTECTNCGNAGREVRALFLF